MLQIDSKFTDLLNAYIELGEERRGEDSITFCNFSKDPFYADTEKKYYHFLNHFLNHFLKGLKRKIINIKRYLRPVMKCIKAINDEFSNLVENDEEKIHKMSKFDCRNFSL